jgi:ATP-dependent protease HslVU (ClpYQ) peptidase subunit
MTCIAAIAHKGKVWMGGDSAGSDSSFSIQTRTDPKVFEKGEFLIGIAGSFRMGNLLRFKFHPPAPAEGEESLEFICTSFLDAVRICFIENGYAQKENNVEVIDGLFLVGWRGSIYCVYEDYQVATVSEEYAAIGCGQDLALGALYSTKDKKPQDRLRNALEAAARFSAGVRGPFVIKSI